MSDDPFGCYRFKLRNDSLKRALDRFNDKQRMALASKNEFNFIMLDGK